MAARWYDGRMMDYHGLIKVGIIVLVGVWASLSVLAVVYYKYMAKKRGIKTTSTKNKAGNVMRAMIYVGIFPIGITCVLAALLIYYLRMPQ